MKKDGRREITRIALLEKSEALFAQHGIEGVSLRQIGTAIGSANTNVVGYHFGTKDALIAAIFEHRLPWLDARRAELLAMADREGCGEDLFTLLHALWRPLFEQTNGEGDHSYAGFLGGLLRSSWQHLRRAVGSDYPATTEIVERIVANMPERARPMFEERLRISSLIVTGELDIIDNGPIDSEKKAPELLFDDCLQMAAAAMGAPAGALR